MADVYEKYVDEIPGRILQDIKKEVVSSKLTNKEIELTLKRALEEYKDAKMHEGEAIGIITAESFGEPGTQMSVPHGSNIIVKINNEIKTLEIGSFVDKLMENNGSLNINNGEILPLNEFNISVPSLNQEEKVEWKKVSECSRHKTPKKLLKLKTKSGREITATDNHSFVIRKNNKIVPIVGASLNIGDRIPVINKFSNENPIRSIFINRFIDCNSLNLSEEGVLSKPGRSKAVRNEIELDWQTGHFIGSYLAEGSCNGGTVGISNINESYISHAKIFADSIGLDYVDRLYMGEYAESRTLNINCSILSRFIINTCKTGSANKQVPQFAYSGDDRFVSGLLRGYFDGDGNFQVDRKMIRCSSNSKELINGVALLLSRFRIFSYKTSDKKGQHWLLIPYKYAPLFSQHIGSDILHKQEALEKLSNMAKDRWNDKSQDYNDMISGFDDLLYKTAKKLGRPTREINSATKRQKIGRTALLRHIKIFENLSKEKNIDVDEELKIMRRMFSSEIIWDEIVKMEYVSDPHPYVYDLSVPGLETFTTAEGIVTHNTLNTFHFSGVAEMNITLGLPRLIEIFDARKVPNTPVMELYLKDGSKKDIKDIKRIASTIKETVLSDIASEFILNVFQNKIEIKINKEIMRDLSITPKQIEEAVSEGLKEKISISDGVIVIKPESKGDNQINELYKLKEKAKTVHIKGIKGISQVLPVKISGEFVILCVGSNIKEALEIKEIDPTRITSNNIFEIADVLGIEAAKQTIMNEALKVIENQYLDIDIRHIMFISDVMTTAGDVRGITRSGITKGKESVFARASFETPLKHLIQASITGEQDRLTSVIENVMLNQPVPLGTGLPGLLAKMKAKLDKKSKK